MNEPPARHWHLKTAALLASPPHRALADTDVEADAWGRALAEEALGAALNDVLWQEALDAHRAAEALDLFPLPEGSVAAGLPLVARHPLSGTVHPLDLGVRTAGEVHQGVLEVVQELRDAALAGGDVTDPVVARRLFLTLWRCLPDELEAAALLPPGTWDLLPAARAWPGVPALSLAQASSAWAGAGERPAVLHFALGSPQAFIGSVRRTQDAYVASYLISYLMHRAMAPIRERLGPDAVLFPSLQMQPLEDCALLAMKVPGIAQPTDAVLGIPNLPNVCAVLVSAADAVALAGDMETAMRTAWDEVARAVRCAMESTWSAHSRYDLAHDSSWSAQWRRQIDGFLDRQGVFWSAVPWPERGTEEAFLSDLESSTLHKDAVSHIRRARQWITAQGKTPHPATLYPLVAKLAAQGITQDKAVRVPPGWVSEPGWKCSLCGEREAVHRHTGTAVPEEGTLRDFWNNLAEMDRPKTGYPTRVDLKLVGRLRRGERLCAVCLTKRLALDAFLEPELKLNRHRFPSTASVAVAPFKAEVARRLDDAKIVEVAVAFTEKADAFMRSNPALWRPTGPPPPGVVAKGLERFLSLEGDLFYPETYDVDAVRQTLSPKALLDGVEVARKAALEALKTLTKQVKGASPSRYLALLALDGDRMGRWVSAQNAPEMGLLLRPDVKEALPVLTRGTLTGMRRPLGLTAHRVLSDLLRDFALRVVEPVVREIGGGTVVYAGGDDVLAFVPACDVLHVTQALRDAYAGYPGATFTTHDGRALTIGDGFAREETAAGRTRVWRLMGHSDEPDISTPTASVGVVVQHESAPLAEGMRVVHHDALEGVAKSQAGRDAFAVFLHKRSGGPLRVGGRFGTGGVLEQVECLVAALEAGNLSPRLADRMRQLSRGLDGYAYPGDAAWVGEARRDVLRVLAGRQSKEGSRGAITNALENLLDTLQVGPASGSSTEEARYRAHVRQHAWMEVARFTRLARFVAGQRADHEGP